MSTTVALRPRPLLLAVVIGVLAATVLRSALVAPWLTLLVLERGAVDWLNASNGLQRFVGILRPSLVVVAIYSPFLFALADWAERKGRLLLRSWLLLGVIGGLPLALLAWFFANDPFDCFTNCQPSMLRNLIVIGSVLVSGALGALTAWLFRYAGRSAAA